MELFLKLLKIRIKSVFSGNGSKEGKGRNIGFKVFIGIMIAYAAVCFIGIFGVYFFRLAENFVEQECGWAYFSMVAIVMMSIGFVTTVFAAQSQIFEAKDNDLLTSMPIPVRYIVLSRIGTLLIIELIESVVIGIEAVLVYNIFAGIPVQGYIFLIFEIIGLNLITATIATLLGWLLAFITSKVHRKAFVTTVATLVLAAGFFALISAGENYLNRMLDNDVTMEDTMNNALYPFYCFGKGIGDGVVSDFLLFMGMSILLFAGLVYGLSPFFLRITTTKKGTLRKKYNPEKNVLNPVKKTLLKKELKRFFTNASYMLNTGMGLLVLTAGSILLLVEKDMLYKVAGDFPYMRRNIGMFLIFIEMFFCMLNVISAPSISLEGEGLWICKSMPLKPSDILMSKVKAHLIICMPFVIMFGVAANIVIPLTPALRAGIFLIPGGATVFTAHLGVVCNLMLPKFDWTDESVAVKQSLAVIATMGIGFGVLVVTFIIFAMIHWFPYAKDVYSVVMFIGFVIASLILNNYLHKKGSKRFLEL